MPDLLDLEQLLNGSQSIHDALGEDLDQGITKLMAQCHPDRHPRQQAEAQELFVKVSAISSALRSPASVQSPKRLYNLYGIMATGDVSDIYFATGVDDEAKNYVVKISRTDGAYRLLETERKALVALHTAAQDDSYGFYYPLLVESFPVQDRIQKRINVFSATEGYHPLPAILKRYDVLEGRHIGWLFRRLLTGLGFAHSQGLVHGAILPQHILVDNSSHGAMICGWGQSVVHGETILYASRDFKGYYPLEVFEKKPATFETDIYMAAMCMLRSLDMDRCDPRIVAFINTCVVERQMSRPDDAWGLADEFAKLLEVIYGPPSYTPLTM